MKKSLLGLTGLFAALALCGEGRAQISSVENWSASDSVKAQDQARTLDLALLPRLPFRGAAPDYYALFAGTIVQDYRGEAHLHHRGSRHDEIDYEIEGINIRSAYTGLPLLRFIPEALHRINLKTAPGASQSHAGVLIQHELRRGRASYSFSARGETDRFSSEYQRRFGTYSYGYADLLFMAEGKILTENIRFFAAGELEKFGDHYRKFWDGFGFGSVAIDPWSKKTLRELSGVDEITIQPGNIPQADSRRYTVNGMITGDWPRGQWRMIGLFNQEQEQRNDTPIRDLFNPQRIPEARQTAGLLSLQSDHALAANINLHVQLDLLRSQNKIYDPLLQDDFHLYYDSTANAARGVEWSNSFLGPGAFYYFAFPFGRPGEVRAKYSKAEENYRSVSGSLQKQFGRHVLKLGAAWQRRTLRKFAIGSPVGFADAYRLYKQQPGFFSLSQLRNWGHVYNYGYNLFGKPIEQSDDVNDGPAHPSSFAVYLEESLRTSNLLLTAGIRYDAFASDGRVFSNPTDPALQNYYENLPLSTMKRAPTHRYVTPRFSAAFVANARLTLKFEYGKYVQTPQLRDVYASRQQRIEFLSNYIYNFTPRALDAEAIHATQAATEIIFQPNAFVRMQTALFHKQISGQLHAEKTVTLREPDREVYYLVLGNDGAAKTQGVEAALTWSRKNWQAWLNYTFSSVRGLTSYPNDNLRSLYVSGQFTTPQQFTPLVFNQKHRGNFLLSYQFDRAAPGWLRQTGVHALAQFNSGHPYILYDPGDALG